MQHEITLPLRVPVLDSQLSLDTLRMSIDYAKTGYGGMDWNLQKGGYKLYFKPIHKTETGFQSMLMGLDKWKTGFYTLIEEIDERKNPHKIKRMHARLESLKGEFEAAYSERNLELLHTLTALLKD